MKLPIYNAQNSKTGDIELSAQFSESYRPDLIKRAVHSLQSKARQAYGANPEAGKRHSSKLSKRRRKYRGSYGFGISRVNRKIHSRRGTRMMWVGTFSPQTRGGRRAHAPKAEKIFGKEINKKENRKAIRAAMAATLNKELVSERGHTVPAQYPFAVDASLESVSKTKDVREALGALGFQDEVKRTLVRSIRAGIGKLRNRRYKTKKGILFVVSGPCALEKAAQNIPGVDVVAVGELNAEVLAPGALPGRVTLWSSKALEQINKEQLFM